MWRATHAADFADIWDVKHIRVNGGPVALRAGEDVLVVSLLCGGVEIVETVDGGGEPLEGPEDAKQHTYKRYF